MTTKDLKLFLFLLFNNVICFIGGWYLGVSI